MEKWCNKNKLQINNKNTYTLSYLENKEILNWSEHDSLKNHYSTCYINKNNTNDTVHKHCKKTNSKMKCKHSKNGTPITIKISKQGLINVYRVCVHVCIIFMTVIVHYYEKL